jgi:hypothetical protein
MEVALSDEILFIIFRCVVPHVFIFLGLIERGVPERWGGKG